VAMSVVLALVLLAYKGPSPLVHADLAVSVTPGRDGAWGTGDEALRIVHRGGDPLDAQATTVQVRVGPAARTLAGDQLGSAWGDGFLRIGEAWSYVWPVPGGIAQGVPVRADVIHAGAASQLLAAASTVAAAVAADPCAADVSPPRLASWSSTPSPLTARHSGSVQVTAILADDCRGVFPTAPILSWRLASGTVWTDTTAVSGASPAFTYLVSGPAWSSLAGQGVVFRVGPLTDGANTAATSPEQTLPIQSDCSTDNVPPAVQGTPIQDPADVRSTTVGAVTVTAVVSDNCAGVDPAHPPRLLYRFNDGSNPPFLDAGAMAPNGTTAATATFRGTIPAQSWPLLAGRTLEYRIHNMTDRNRLVGSGPVHADPIEALFTYTYANAFTATAGTVLAAPSPTFPNCCSPGAGSDGGLEANLVEGGTTAASATAIANANAVVAASGWASATNAFAADNAYATYASNGPLAANDLRLDLQDPAVTTGTICASAGCVVLRAEVSVTGFSNDGFQIYPCLAGGLCSAASPLGGQSASDVVLSYDITALRPGGGAWTWTDVANLQGAVSLVQGGTRDGTWRVDRVWVDVTSAATTY
ncbi:MAG TPA: hypothetical protein VHI93_07790, partial [Candidatus Thermoplasmatota archaeon]|nr:hypothetical protein [Candidatus Thermoplasmatota archaeon]